MFSDHKPGLLLYASDNNDLFIENLRRTNKVSE